MTTLREAAQQALEALEYGQHTLKRISEYQWESRGVLAMNALRAALAEPVQEPVAYMESLADNECADAYADGWNDCVKAHKGTTPPQRKPEPVQEPSDPSKVICPACCHQFRAIPEDLQTQLAEPVAWMTHGNDPLPLFHKTKAGALAWGAEPLPLYTAPPQRKPLTEGVLMGVYIDFDRTADPAWSGVEYLLRLCRAVERAHGIGGQDSGISSS